MKILVAGGAGFIGSNFVPYALDRWPACSVTVLDKLTYAGNPANLEPVRDDPRFTFVQGDICSSDVVHDVMHDVTHVINFAAETHVDRSILDPGAFVRTDVEGTRILLEAAVDRDVERYLQVSTDEVYGAVEAPHRASEETTLQPRSPYSASKAGGDLLVGAYHATYSLPTLITRGSNTYGPRQYPEKLVPLFITNALDGLALPVYGDGTQMRDWLHVADHCSGIATVLERGTPGGIYNLGTATERTNIEVINEIVRLTGCDPALVRHVQDRPGHDRRYALQVEAVHALGWAPQISFPDGIAATVEWYRRNRSWWEPIKSGSFRDYYERQYGQRLAETLA